MFNQWPIHFSSFVLPLSLIDKQSWQCGWRERWWTVCQFLNHMVKSANYTEFRCLHVINHFFGATQIWLRQRLLCQSLSKRDSQLLSNLNPVVFFSSFTSSSPAPTIQVKATPPNRKRKRWVQNFGIKEESAVHSPDTLVLSFVQVRPVMAGGLSGLKAPVLGKNSL